MSKETSQTTPAEQPASLPPRCPSVFSICCKHTTQLATHLCCTQACLLMVVANTTFFFFFWVYQLFSQVASTVVLLWLANFCLWSCCIRVLSKNGDNKWLQSWEFAAAVLFTQNARCLSCIVVYWGYWPVSIPDWLKESLCKFWKKK